MSDISRRRSLRFFFLFISIFLQFLSGFSDDSNSQKDKKPSSGSRKGSTIFIICIGLAAVVGLSSYLFKLWQKKKREEQHARLLKLFEEDDELELELGLSD
ncbi:hypothetical protein L1987_54953 [Smallanthus sonchifolius]|uniref:Uncharacterized protein n=1 Tax=Smallanthus sonchifolius TaxID=185202 RepID=A0ACB9E985_9ASTR|nr:hypothetical protein L1987_54953 [Smallanthus sonchifolius]